MRLEVEGPEFEFETIAVTRLFNTPGNKLASFVWRQPRRRGCKLVAKEAKKAKKYPRFLMDSEQTMHTIIRLFVQKFGRSIALLGTLVVSLCSLYGQPPGQSRKAPLGLAVPHGLASELKALGKGVGEKGKERLTLTGQWTEKRLQFKSLR